jgi:hypothetical protein
MTFNNPVYHEYLADPFCFRHGDWYYAVYHAWNETRTDRLMCVDRLDWHNDRPSIARFRLFAWFSDKNIRPWLPCRAEAYSRRRVVP